MAPESIMLEGAPDALIGTPDAKGNAVQVMQLDMTNDVLDELLDCFRRSKPPQVLFGRTPMIRYEGKSYGLESGSEKYRNELYQLDEESKENEWSFAGLINHHLTIQKVEEASANMDKALETLKNNMASIEQEREARKLTVSTPEMRAANRKNGLSKAQARATLLNPLLSNSGRSNPSSPALGASTPSHLAAPTSAGLDSNMPITIAGRKVLVHLLATKSQTYERCRKLVHFNCRDLLEKIGKKTEANEWALQDRAYKELDVWKFKYQKDEERQTAIDNAIRAYDRMRVPKEDNQWQMLLTPDERGKGKVLSRLNIQNAPAAVKTPAQKAKSFDKKTGLPKRADQKKPVDKEAVKAKKSKDGQEESTKPAKTTNPRTSKAEATKERMAAKRKERASADDNRTPARKQAKPSTAAKSLLNKPKNPSPLSASPPVNASDFEDNHPVHKALSAAVSPKKAAKRKADDMTSESARRQTQNQTNGPNKRRHLDSSSSSNTSPSSQPLSTLAHHTTKTNGLTNGHTHSQSHRHSQHSPQSSDTSADGSPPISLSWRQSVELAKKFKVYYDRYAKLHEELSNSFEPPSQAKREELLQMHQTLQDMKRDVRNGAL